MREIHTAEIILYVLMFYRSSSVFFSSPFFPEENERFNVSNGHSKVTNFNEVLRVFLNSSRCPSIWERSRSYFFNMSTPTSKVNFGDLVWKIAQSSVGRLKKNHLFPEIRPAKEQSLKINMICVSGAIRGIILEPHSRHLEPVEAFLGVPYGFAERLQPPRPASAWMGTRLADSFGPVCPQRYPDVSNKYVLHWESYIHIQKVEGTYVCMYRYVHTGGSEWFPLKIVTQNVSEDDLWPLFYMMAYQIPPSDIVSISPLNYCVDIYLNVKFSKDILDLFVEDNPVITEFRLLEFCLSNMFDIACTMYVCMYLLALTRTCTNIELLNFTIVYTLLNRGLYSLINIILMWLGKEFSFFLNNDSYQIQF